MVASRDFTRMDTQELKDLIFQKIGSERAEKYFEQLKRFLGYKLSKAELDKSCLQTLGREYIPLHNRLIRAIVYNSCQSTIPPQKARKVEGLGVRVASGYQRACFQSLYGDGLPSSPRKCRSPVNRERKFRDRPSPLGPLGKSPSFTCEETVSRIQEQSGAELHSSCTEPRRGEEEEEVEQFTEISSEWKSITAPYGISIVSGWNQKTHFPVDSSRNFTETCQSSGVLPDTISLMRRLETKLASDGVTISLEAANVLNKGLDLYLKRILEAQSPLVGNGSCHRDQHYFPRQQNSQIQTSQLRMLDFQVAMDMNPHVLGENWALYLEKILHNSFQ